MRFPQVFLFLSTFPLIWSQRTKKALIYTATRGFRHDSIPTAVDAIRAKASDISVEFDHTEDASTFKDDNLGQYDGVIFLSATGEVLDNDGKDAFQRYLNSGGNFVGIHSASDALNTTGFYGQEIGAFFDYHPERQDVTLLVLDSSHPSTQSLPQRWNVNEEIYNFRSDPRDVGAVVILSIDESTYTDPGPRRFDQGDPHPLAWYQERGAGVQEGSTPGRSFYTSIGHLNETWQDETFMSHIMGGIQWALANSTRESNSSEGEGEADVPSSDGSGSDSGSEDSAGRLSYSIITLALGVGVLSLLS